MSTDKWQSLRRQMIIHNGKEYARVTEILNPFNDFSHIDPKVLEDKTKLGTMVHDAIADDINEEMPILTPKAAKYFASYCKWASQANVSFIASEQRYFHDGLMITGKIDALAKMPGENLPVLVDFKTSASPSDTWPMQGHFYQLLLEFNEISIAPRFLFVKLDKDGNFPKVFEYKFELNMLAKCLKSVDLFWKSKKSDCQ